MNKLLPTLSVGELMRTGEARLQTGPFGTQLKASEYVAQGIPVINVRNVGFGEVRADDLEYISEAKAEQLHHHIIREGDIVFGRKGAVERHALIKKEQDGWAQGSDCLRLRLNSPRVSSQYLSYYLRTQAHQDWMQALCSFGATMNSLNQNIVARIQFPLPSLQQQRKVVSILSTYDDLIANNQRRIALLESMAEEIYREWFVRMRSPGGYTPRAQGLSPFDYLCVLSRGFDLPDSDMKPGDVPVIASASIKGYHNVAKVKPPVVTTGRSGSLGTVLLVNEPAWPLNTALYVKDFKGNSPYLVFFTLKNLHLENFNVGAGVPMLNRNHLAGIRVSIPPLGVQQAFDRRIGPMLQLSETLKKSNAGLTAQRDALLPRLISGRLRIDQLDIQTPPSMRADTAPAV